MCVKRAKSEGFVFQPSTLYQICDGQIFVTGKDYLWERSATAPLLQHKLWCSGEKVSNVVSAQIIRICQALANVRRNGGRRWYYGSRGIVGRQYRLKITIRFSCTIFTL